MIEKFIGRKLETNMLLSCWDRSSSKLTVIYGRRRIGKSTFVEHSYRKGKILKFEGLEGLPTKAQKKQFVAVLSQYFKEPKLLKYESSSWIEIFEELSLQLKKQPAVVFFDEFQWLAANRLQLVSELKYAWDNFFKANNNIHLILCGSISSFMVKKVLRSKALFGRVDLSINLQPLYFDEILSWFKKDIPFNEVLEYYFTFGGVPAYWEKINYKESLRFNFSRLFLSRNSYFLDEINKIFISHFGSDSSYRKIVEYLAQVSYADNLTILKKTKLSVGGRSTRNLEDLELAGFIKSYTPIFADSKSSLKRYYISDPYLRFYFKFIAPQIKVIQSSRSPLSIQSLYSDQQLAIWRGLSLEKICLSHANILAQRLGFSDVKYAVGSYFTKRDRGAGFQIDVLFVRDDRVITVCEVKNITSTVGTNIITDFKHKVTRLQERYASYRIQKVLITNSEPSKELVASSYFDKIVLVKDLFTA